MNSGLLPPHNIEAEQAVLGSIMLNNMFFGVISDVIGPPDFFEPLHAQIILKMGEVIGSGQKANAVTLKDAFPDIEVISGVTIHKYLARIMAAGAMLRSEVDEYANRVRDLSAMRGVIGVAGSLSRASSNGILPSVAIADAWDEIDAIRTQVRERVSHRGSVADLAPLLLETDTATVAPSGLVDLDRAIAGGWRSGRLYILAGRPGMGKTILGLTAARRVARRGHGVSLFSLEIDAREILSRLVADELSHGSLPVPYRDIVAGTLSDGDKGRVATAADHLSKLPLRVDASGGHSMTDIEAYARIDSEIFRKDGRRLGAVVVDYLGLVKAADRYRGNKVHELGEIALAAKTMAKKLDCAVIMLAQLNRQVEARDDKRPSMSDLRDSGNIEEHADFVGLLYRPFYYTERSPGWRDQVPEAIQAGEAQRNKLELIIGKNRLGATTVVNLWCDPAVSCIDNLSRFQ